MKRSIFRTICLLLCLAPSAVFAADVDFGLQVNPAGQQGGSGGSGTGTYGAPSVTAPSPSLAPAPSACESGPSDLNCDGRVNLQDISILLVHFREKNPPARYDLNGDGKANLADLSILLHFFYKK